MKLVMTLVVRDEEEILEANLEYHFAQGVDFVIVTDHGSSDSTPAILRRYEQRGLARVLRVEGVQHHQSQRVTRMAGLAAIEYAADWIINNDADEFWWPAVGSLADLFAAIPQEYGQIEAPRNNFLPRPVEDDRPFYERLVVREKASRNLIGGPLEPKVAHRADPGIVVAPGNHYVTGGALAPTPSCGLVEVLHFPMRTLAQFERKVLATGIGYESLPFRSQDVGRDQLKLLELQRNGKLPQCFAERLLSDDAVGAGLRSGELVLDRRLARFMAELDHARPVSGADSARPDSDSARAIVAAAVRGEAQLADVVRRLEAAESRAEDRLALRADLDLARQRLAVIESSRSWRLTRPLRSGMTRVRRLLGQ
jgi:hypothetical protein